MWPTKAGAGAWPRWNIKNTRGDTLTAFGDGDSVRLLDAVKGFDAHDILLS